MNTIEVLTLLLVIFAALSYIDHQNSKKNNPFVLTKGFHPTTQVLVLLF